MTTYKEIHGRAIKFVSADLSQSGEIFYNSTAGSFKSVIQSAAWASVSPTTSVHGSGSGCGNVPAVVVWGANNPASNATEEWNGSGWTTSGNYPFSGFGATGSAGTQTAALGIGGRTTTDSVNVTAEYDGSTWTTGGNFPEINYGTGGFGTQTAAVAYGGNNRTDAGPSNPDGSGTQQYTKEYNGSAWTAGNNYPIAVSTGTATGSLTAGLAAGGSNRPDGTPVTDSATYDGTNWTTVTAMPAARASLGASGTQTSAIVFGGFPSGTEAFQYDGTSWSETADLASPGYGGGSGHNSTPTGSTSALLGARRSAPGSAYPTATEEFSQSTTVITAGAWASGGNLNTSRKAIGGGFGTTTAGLIAGGNNSSNEGIADSEEYNGTSWTEGPNMNYGRGWLACCGTQTAALGSGGYDIPQADGDNKTEEYDGSTWTNGGNLNQEMYGGQGFGTQTAGVKAGGYNSSLPPGNVTAQTEEYDGSSWTVNPNSMGVARYVGGGTGTATAGLVSGGYRYSAPSGRTNVTEEYDGTNWTTGGTLNNSINKVGVSGTQTATLLFGGVTPSVNYAGFTEAYDGSSWSTRPSLATGRSGGGGSFAGTTASAFYAGGELGPATSLSNATEEFTGATTAANVKTITTS